MKPSHFTLCVALVVVFCGCSPRTDIDHTKILLESNAAGDWGFLQFSAVRAYRLNWKDEDAFERLVGKDNKLNRTRIPKNGISLNLEQVDRLRQAVTGSHPSHPIAFCFYPHHAFAFYDDQGQMVGHIDICFLCSNYAGKPKGFAKNWDLKNLALLIEDLGMPISNPKWD